MQKNEGTQTHLPTRQRVVVRVEEVVTRDFPSDATIHVKAGDTVAPETIIATYETSGGFRVFHLDEVLGVSKKHVGKYVRKKVGERIYQGEVLATKSRTITAKPRRFLSFFRPKELRSPVDGSVASISLEGDMTVRVLPQRISQASLFWGKVSTVTPNSTTEADKNLRETKTVAIATQVIKVYGVMGSGRQREGRVAVMCEAEDFLLPHKIEQSVENSVLICGSLIERGSLEKALAQKVSGIVAGGIHLRDATAMGMRVPQGEGTSGTDVGISLIATEGFGPVAIGTDVFSVLKEFDGRYVTIFGNEACIGIPLREEEVAKYKDTLQNATQKEAGNVPAKIGLPVRLLVEEYFGKIGIITGIASEDALQRKENGTSFVVVAIGSGDKKQSITVPTTNVEVLI